MKKIIISLIVSILSISSLHGAYSDAGTDYTKAKTDFWTSIDATESLKAINSIICFTQHLRPELMVNKGVYSALINNQTCSQKKVDKSKSQNDYIIANVTRESNTSPQVMNIWIPKDEVNLKMVKVRMEVTKEASEADSFGQFNITWQLFDQNEASRGKGELKTVSLDSGNIGLTMFIDYSNLKSSISIDKKPDGSQGLVLTKDYKLAWNGNFVNVKKSTKNISTCLDKTQLNREVWSYGVYKKDNGSSLNINTGFPFEATKGGKIIQGYLGYWGISIDGDTVEGESLSLLSDIKKFNYADNTKTHITIEKVGGKYIATNDDGTKINFSNPVTLTDDTNSFMYSGGGSLSNPNSTNLIGLEDAIILKDTKTDTNYVVKGLQGIYTLKEVKADLCDNIELNNPATPLPTSIESTNFNESTIPDRPANVSIVDGELQN
jgi:hypothetical protein